jgi:hypothetical protein
MNKKNILGVVIILVINFVIRNIYKENIPFPITVICLMFCTGFAFVFALKYKGGKVERTFLLAITILLTLLISVVVIATLIQNSYPQFSAQYKPLFIVLMGLLFVILLIVIFANAIYKSNKVNK